MALRMALALAAPSTAPMAAGYGVGAWTMNSDALGTSTQGMWHDPTGIIYPYDAEDLAIIEAAKRAKLEQDRADCMNIHDE